MPGEEGMVEVLRGWRVEVDDSPPGELDDLGSGECLGDAADVHHGVGHEGFAVTADAGRA